MAKWYGNVGYIDSIETTPGIWEEQEIDRPYFGDSIRNTRLLQNSGEINDNVNIGNHISIVADPYAINHIHAMRYAEFQGTKWKITNVDVQYPRLILTIGGIYHG